MFRRLNVVRDDEQGGGLDRLARVGETKLTAEEG